MATDPESQYTYKYIHLILFQNNPIRVENAKVRPLLFPSAWFQVLYWLTHTHTQTPILVTDTDRVWSQNRMEATLNFHLPTFRSGAGLVAVIFNVSKCLQSRLYLGIYTNKKSINNWILFPA